MRIDYSIAIPWACILITLGLFWFLVYYLFF